MLKEQHLLTIEQAFLAGISLGNINRAPSLITDIITHLHKSTAIDVYEMFNPYEQELVSEKSLTEVNQLKRPRTTS